MNQLLAMRAFVHVLDTGSFGRAADHLKLPRSTVSKLVADLEAHLGIKLIQRTTRAVSATSEGEDYRRNASRILSELEAIDQALRGKTVKPSGHLRIESTAVVANHLLIPALPDFQREFPDVTVSLGIGDRTANIVGEGVDCAIRAGNLNDSGMIGRKLCELEYVTCAAPNYLRGRGLPASPRELEKHALVGYFFTGTGRSEPLVFDDGRHRESLEKVHYAANDGNGVTQMILAGLGIGQPLRRIVQPHLDAGTLVEVMPSWTRPSLPLHLVYPPSQHQSAKLKVFVEWMLARFKA